MVKTALLYDNFAKPEITPFDVIIWFKMEIAKKWLERILALVRSTI